MTAEGMWGNSAFLPRLVASSVKIVERAGGVIRRLAGGDLKIETKEGPKDLQTEADRAAQFCIVKSLHKKFSEELCIIGEEEKQSYVPTLEEGFDENVLQLAANCPEHIKAIQLKDVVVWVDPLDGTAEFTQGVSGETQFLEQVTTLIGIAHAGRPIAGIIHQPYSKFDSQSGKAEGRTIWAIEGVGVHGLQTPSSPSEGKMIVTTRSHWSATVQGSIDAIMAQGLANKVLSVGGAGFKVLKTVEDPSVLAYIFSTPGCKKWDTCAPEAILNEYGGKLTDSFGNLLGYDPEVQRLNSAGVIATKTSASHEAFISAIPPQVKEKLHVIVPKK